MSTRYESHHNMENNQIIYLISLTCEIRTDLISSNRLDLLLPLSFTLLFKRKICNTSFPAATPWLQSRGDSEIDENPDEAPERGDGVDEFEYREATTG